MVNWQLKLDLYKRLIRWDRPIGTWLLLWPTLSALWLASKGHPQASLLCIFILGAMCTRAAGCIINDILDRDFDGFVERTQSRPLAQKEMSIKEALTVCVVLLLISLIMVLQLNRLCLFIAVVSIALMAIYPLMKRWIPWPQVVLGAIFNGVLMAYAAEQDAISWSGWLLYFVSWLWTISYDSFYAMADSKDDRIVGIKSIALYFDKRMPTVAMIMQGVIVSLLILLGVGLGLNHWYYWGLTAVLLTFIYQQYLIRQFDPSLCFKAFLNNHYSWFYLFFGIFLSYL